MSHPASLTLSPSDAKRNGGLTAWEPRTLTLKETTLPFQPTDVRSNTNISSFEQHGRLNLQQSEVSISVEPTSFCTFANNSLLLIVLLELCLTRH